MYGRRVVANCFPAVLFLASFSSLLGSGWYRDRWGTKSRKNLRQGERLRPRSG
jgi:hypothetical protein